MNLTAYFFFTKSFFLSVLPFIISYGNICSMKQKILNHWENIKNPSQNYFFYMIYLSVNNSELLQVFQDMLEGFFFYLPVIFMYLNALQITKKKSQSFQLISTWSDSFELHIMYYSLWDITSQSFSEDFALIEIKMIEKYC